MTRSLSALLCVVLASSTLAACQAAEEGPELPPGESMSMDIAAFSSSGKTDKADDTGSKKNFNQAAFRVTWLNTSILLALASPRLVFAAALSTEPTFADGKWTWSITAGNAAKRFTAELTGWFEGNAKTGNTLELEMRVTCKGVSCKLKIDNFLWYTGHFEFGKRKGYWQFYNPDIKQDDKTFVHIDWQVTDATHRKLTFTNKRTDGHKDANDVIAYERDGDALSVDVHDADAKLDYSAEIDVHTGVGWLQVPNYNGGAKACWDGSHNDKACE